MNKDIRFIWDAGKERANKQKHKVSFSEAQTVFLDDFARMIHDTDHSANEDRFLLLGLSVKARILVVCHCYREDDEVIRIISARKAAKREREQYYEKRI